MCALVYATQAGVVEDKLVEDKLVGQRPHPPRVRELQPRLFNPVAVWLQ